MSQPQTSQSKVVTLADRFSTAFGLGLIPNAPGTWGSLPGLPLALGLHALAARCSGAPWREHLNAEACLWALFFLGLASAFATWCIKETEAAWGCHDDKRIVIDEVVGQMVALVWFAPSWHWVASQFVLFRVFDIYKPGPAGWVDRRCHSPFATLADDLIAGVYAAFFLAAWQFFD